MTKARLAAVVGVLIAFGVGLASSCLLTSMEPPPQGLPPDYATVRVFYATDRAVKAPQMPSTYYGSERSPDGLKLGHCDVSIPRDHRIAEIERPSLWKFEYREDPEKHVVLLNVQQRSYDAFYEAVRGQNASSQEKAMLVFIHGFNVTFEDASHRTAQLAYDLGLDGVPVMYSWPAPALYTESTNNVNFTWRHLRWFLRDLATRSGASTIHVVAHSMGNQVLTSALNQIATEEPAMLPVFNQVFLAAPDVDADVFKQLAGAIAKAGKRITLYASSTDLALKASHEANGYVRAGDTHPSVVVVPGVDTIDVSSIDTSFLGHSYFGEKRTVVTDMFYLMRHDSPPLSRAGIQAVSSPSGNYYRFVPGT